MGISFLCLLTINLNAQCDLEVEIKANPGAEICLGESVTLTAVTNQEVEIPEDTTPIAPLFLLEFLLTQDSAYLDSLLSSDTIELELLQLLEKDSMWFNNFEEQQDTNKLKNNGQN